ncbi:Uncharacterized conserved protein YndB, AHSA1/START domain [Andreprevotia lacus DSM 23236]|jgi:uncharacterized protein YndB with AHSA1/START domain|uniref:Uncharacterized conserved protein YndB, AHSA1/START domain n=1 Tax=Andreprevotia lacus DSM 23236 TaxID=1121001 RepID=A0A1W1XVJ7_9NEIS|nr:SRPBCC domain-containing protein [Andreprevotia lacus]SMC27936.1 Uncharacterized conserved protein YndB, AHSA1/START domain [Andreprevotia lacus DSM 23236]
MSHYQSSLIIAASPATVYAALTTADGLRGWWTADCDVATGVGGELRFRFGAHYKHMRIEKLDPAREVRWRCTVAHLAVDTLKRHDEWVGTELSFRLTGLDDGRTRLDFEHIGLTPTLECYDLCSGGWDHFLASLQQYAQTGQGTPAASSCAEAAAQ